MKKKEFRVSESQIAKGLTPITTWSMARLFWGVPKWAKKVTKDMSTGDLIFTK